MYEEAVGSFKYLSRGIVLSIIGCTFTKQIKQLREHKGYIDFNCSSATDCNAVLRIQNVKQILPVFLSAKMIKKNITAKVELLNSHTCGWLLAQSRALKFLNQLRGYDGELNS